MNNKEFISELSTRMGFSTADTQRLERIMVNPSTGQRMLVPPKLVLGFKPSTTWKDKLKKGGQE